MYIYTYIYTCIYISKYTVYKHEAHLNPTLTRNEVLPNLWNIPFDTYTAINSTKYIDPGINSVDSTVQHVN